MLFSKRIVYHWTKIIKGSYTIGLKIIIPKWNLQHNGIKVKKLKEKLNKDVFRMWSVGEISNKTFPSNEVHPIMLKFAEDMGLIHIQLWLKFTPSSDVYP